MAYRTVEVVAEVVTAIGTVSVAFVAGFGDWLENIFFGPRLKLSLVDARGVKIPRRNGTQAYFYHIRVKNCRRRVAKSVQIRVQRVSKRVPGGKFLEQEIVCPLPLDWTPRKVGIEARNVFGEDICDFGFLDSGAAVFSLATRWKLTNFRGDVAANETARFEIIGSGEN